jgi:GTP-binding protein HflX
MERVLVFTTTEDTEEIHSLLDTLDISVVKVLLQNRTHPHKVGFLGPGRLDEIKKEIEDLEYDAIIVNGTLKPSQHHYLEMKFQKECLDRTGVILRIFAEHAHTPEAIAQVTLAKLRYELPFLREWVHKAKEGDKPGFLAGGAYATDVYFEHAKSHARRIEENLEELSRQREITRVKRHSRGYSLVSLAGYTNAGKSALFNAMCGAEVEVDNRLFSTLSTTTRKVKGIPGNVLMVDTVGFIRNLPTDLIDAFNSTLEEVFYADLILLVFDSSDPIESIKEKIETSTDILLPKIEQQMLIFVANKIDLLSDSEIDKVRSVVSEIAEPHEMRMVSARTGKGIDSLKELVASIQKRTSLIEAELPLTDASYSLLSKLRSSCTVSERIEEKRLVVTLKCKSEEAEKVSGWIAKIGGTITSTGQEPSAAEASGESKTSSGSEGAPLSSGPPRS